MNNSPLTQWHLMLESKDLSQLDQLIDEKCIFHSPIVFKPQEGKRLTVMYLTAAFQMFSQADYFKYIKEIVQDRNAMLEFNAAIDGILIDGIDLITWNESGRITEFKVMVRPLKAIDLIKEKMLAQLSSLSTIDKLKLKGGVLWDKLKP
ncbi:MAG: nuclear transport factor 2 family protein [Reichenbachiella sp.]|uniref:nuclear transport factor 2 family protein n=1 Tax=Reichenbachiella sp. TaxID=2184521 RepID=UPI00329A2DC8